jgi:cell division protein FtsB
LSQAANTFWDERIERAAASAEVSPVVKRRVRARRLVDAIILAIILAAAATCVSVYSRARAELGAALNKHEAAGEKVKDLTIRVEKVERDVQRLRTDSRVIELFARQKFGFVRSGDVVIKLAQEQNDASKNGGEVRVANLTPRLSEGYTDASN